MAPDISPVVWESPKKESKDGGKNIKKSVPKNSTPNIAGRTRRSTSKTHSVRQEMQGTEMSSKMSGKNLSVNN